MSEARPIGEFVQPILDRCARYIDFQEHLNSLETDAERKDEIMRAYMGGLIDDEACGLLIQAYGIEAA